MLCSHSVEYCPVINRIEVQIYATNMGKSRKLAAWKKPDQKGHIFYNSTYVDNPEQANPYTEDRFVVGRCWGERGSGNDCLMGTCFRLGMMKMFWNYIEVELGKVAVPIAPEIYIFKSFVLRYMNFTSLKQVKQKTPESLAHSPLLSQFLSWVFVESGTQSWAVNSSRTEKGLSVTCGSCQ